MKFSVGYFIAVTSIFVKIWQKSIKREQIFLFPFYGYKLVKSQLKTLKIFLFIA
jgi:hypothetical protein